MGYDPESKKKIIISQKDLETCLKGLEENYKIKVSVERSAHFNFSLTKLMAKLIPEKMKQEIVKQEI